MGLIFLCLLIAGCQKHDEFYQGYIDGDYTYLSSAVSGTLGKLAISRGNQVEKGQLIYVLDQQPESDQLKQAEFKFKQAEKTLDDIKKGQRPAEIESIKAQRAQVEAQMIFDKKTLDRYQKLVKTGAIDKSSVDLQLSKYQSDVKKIKEINANLALAKLGQREDQIKAQEAVVTASKAGVKQAQWALQQKTIYAPQTGQIFDTFYREGEFVMAGHPVAALLAPQNVKLIFYIPENILGKTKNGQKIIFNCDGCPTKYEATINYISSKTEYTPPVIFSRESREKLVFRVYAKVAPNIAKKLHVGQPIDVFLNNK